MRGPFLLFRFYAIRTLEGLGLTVFVAMVLDRLHALLATQSAIVWCVAILVMPVAYYLADLLTGVIHWICDSFGDEHTPVWGPLLVGPFRRHHRDPLEITRISLLENLGASAIAGALVLWLGSSSTLGQAPQDRSIGAVAWGLLGIWTVVFAVISNLFHRWSHMPLRNKPAWMRLLQDYGLSLRPEAHMQHHKRPHRVNYCILNGWANPLSNRVPWTRLEAMLARIGIPTNFD